MANIDLRCSKCGSRNLKVRTSQRMTQHSTQVLLFCGNCNACRMTAIAQITDVAIANYEINPKALQLNKPLDETDERQVEIPTQ